MEARPARMFTVLQECGALERVLPEVPADAARMQVLDAAADADAPLPVRFACLTLDLGPALRPLCERLRVPNECRDVAEVATREHAAIMNSAAADAADTVRLLERCDAFRKPQRFEQVLLACECDARGRGRPLPPRQRLLAAL